MLDFVDRLYTTWRLPPLAAVLFSVQSSFPLEDKRNGGLDFLKAAVVKKWRVKISLLCDGFFSFAVARQVVSFALILTSNSHRNVTDSLCFDRIMG